MARLEEIAEQLRAAMEIRSRRYHWVTYERCFVGSEAVSVMEQLQLASGRSEAVSLGQQLMDAGLIRHVVDGEPFGDGYLFYQFVFDGDHYGASREQWEEHDAEKAKELLVEPLSNNNRAFLDQAHPMGWKDPEPSDERYNLVVIGAGTAGLVSAAGSALTGAKVALIEEHFMGGDCLCFGCVPSKALLRCAKAAYAVRTASEFGISVSDYAIDFAKVMEKVREGRATIAPHDSAKRLASFGIDVFVGRGTFIKDGVVEVNGKQLEYTRAVVATGARAYVPPIEGLQSLPYLTNATIWNLTERPETLGIIGAGPIGIEMAQAFARLGSNVIVFDKGTQILPREDKGAADILGSLLTAEGVKFEFDVTLSRVEQEGASIRITFERDGAKQETSVSHLLVATGRAPNVEKLGLENVGVAYNTRNGVETNQYYQSSNKHIFACGDVCSSFKFTHAAEFMARAVIRNALFFGRVKKSSLLIPWCTYTDPEIAHVGSDERQLQHDGTAFDSYTIHLSDVDRAIVDRETEGFVKLLCLKDKEKILGATIVGPHAGDMISEVTIAIQNRIGLSKLAAVIHPYPTIAEAIRQCADQYGRKKLKGTTKGILHAVMQYRRS